jgi:sigma-E factor negative regulatory protein RseC
MIEQEARVRAVDGDIAEVVVMRQSTCGGCQAKSGCGTALVGDLFPNREMALRLANTQQARTGDRVLVGLPEATLQVAALLLYGLPLLALLVGAMAGQWLAETSNSAAEPGAILGGLFGLMAGLMAARRLGQSNDARPVMLRRLPAQAVSFCDLELPKQTTQRSSEK